MMRRHFVVVAAALALAACRGRAARDGGALTAVAADAPAPRATFEARADSTDLVFFWFDEHGGPHAVTRAADVPEARRAAVRVDPPRPEMRAPGWVYLVDLRNPSPQGVYPMRSVRADELSQQVLAMAGVSGPLGTQAPAQPSAPAQPAQPGAARQPSGAAVILYGASWCSACHATANWLRGHNVAFVEKDIEQDPGAQQEMVAKAQRAGVPTGSIPILDVRGRILVGFSPPDIERALAGG